MVLAMVLVIWLIVQWLLQEFNTYGFILAESVKEQTEKYIQKIKLSSNDIDMKSDKDTVHMCLPCIHSQ